ncbi:N(4)-(beta-N-acetylglucosaminyl)-L-asparaginase [Acidobacteria bacterium AH-259-G07]|nr:N(4)-(beta-N-acetylglucosaminyl)-L-asparaginase [Acidobacteria bacterium AH-259-G07]
MNRRRFLNSTVAGIAVCGLSSSGQGGVQGGGRPAVIASANGLRATEKAREMMRQGADTLDAVIAGVNLVEEDPKDTSVGYGGLPNEEGVVQLDSSVMHGPTRGSGAVAALESIKYPSRVAKLVMERTDHVLLVGEGALKFALAMGFEKQNLLTPEAREIWLKWKRELSPQDDWINPEDRLPESIRDRQKKKVSRMLFNYGTINCNAVNDKGEISGVTTTSGLSFKIPGRVGDSPIIGAGLYVDNHVGACGSTGRGEANLKTCASFMVVEFMRRGLSPEEAGLRVLKRIVENTVEPYLIDHNGRPKFDVKFYALNKRGEFAGTAIWSGSKYAAHDGAKNKHYEVSYLFKREKTG